MWTQTANRSHNNCGGEYRSIKKMSESVQTFGRKVEIKFNSSILFNVFANIENCYCCCLHQEGNWFNQSQWIPNQLITTWNLKVEDLRAFAFIGCWKVRQRKELKKILTVCPIIYCTINYRSISESESRVVEQLLKSMPLDRLLLRVLLLTTKNVSRNFRFHFKVLYLFFVGFSRWWSFQAWNQGYLGSIWPNFISCWSSQMRTKEIRWSRCPRPLPEILPLNQL